MFVSKKKKLLINFFCLFVALLVHAELMLLGFISLLLTVGQGTISTVCVSQKIGATMHPCSKEQEEAKTNSETNGRRLLTVSDSGKGFRRILAGAASSTDKCAARVCVYSVFCLFLYLKERIGNTLLFSYIFIIMCLLNDGILV